MTKLEQAARQALEALIKANHFHDYEDEITALREALAEQAEQEPVGWYSHKGGFNECGEGQPLYAAPIEPVKQEPVCSVCCKPHDKDNPVGYFYPPANELDSWEQAAACDDPDAVPLYAAPVRTKDLTDDEIEAIVDSVGAYEVGYWQHAFARAVIAADRELNK